MASRHDPPHFHAEYGSEEAVFDINNLALIAGWDRARVLESPGKIEPLR